MEGRLGIMATWRMPAQALVRALLDDEVEQARGMIAAALATSGQRVSVFADLVQPALAGVSDLWYRGEISPADEARAVSMAADLAQELPPTPVARPVAEGSRIVLAALGDEQHGIGMDLLALAVEDEGWAVESLGVLTPPDVLLASVAAQRPDVVGLSASYLPSSRLVRDAIAALKARRINVLVGGQAFNREHGLWRSVGADGHGVDARVGVVMARRLLGTTPVVTLLRTRRRRGGPAPI